MLDVVVDVEAVLVEVVAAVAMVWGNDVERLNLAGRSRSMTLRRCC